MSVFVLHATYAAAQNGAIAPPASKPVRPRGTAAFPVTLEAPGGLPDLRSRVDSQA